MRVLDLSYAILLAVQGPLRSGKRSAYFSRFFLPVIRVQQLGSQQQTNLSLVVCFIWCLGLLYGLSFWISFFFLHLLSPFGH